MEYCPLCRLEPDQHDLLWRAEQEGGYPGAEAEAQRLGVSVGRREIRRHFEYHYPRQARARSISSARALKMMEKGTERRRKIADLLFRVPGLNGKTIGAAIHWSGAADKLVSADKAAQRDLRQMLNADTAHRIFLPNLPGPAARPTDLKGYFFLGANARSFIEELYGIELRPRDWLAEQSALRDWRLIYPQISAHNLLGGQQSELAGSVSWSARNWLGSHLLPSFDNPYSLAKRVQADGMMALSWGGNIFPFFYLVDNGSRTSDQLQRELNAPLALQQSNQQLQFFPDISPDLVIPIIVISTGPSRFNRLREIRPGFDSSGLLALACQSENLSFQEKSFIELFNSRWQEPRSLVEALASHYQSAPVPGPWLRFRR